eukprot:2091702-Pleurochrysis_carterae.AAC.1
MSVSEAVARSLEVATSVSERLFSSSFLRVLVCLCLCDLTEPAFRREVQSDDRRGEADDRDAGRRRARLTKRARKADEIRAHG